MLTTQRCVVIQQGMPCSSAGGSLPLAGSKLVDMCGSVPGEVVFTGLQGLCAKGCCWPMTLRSSTGGLVVGLDGHVFELCMGAGVQNVWVHAHALRAGLCGWHLGHPSRLCLALEVMRCYTSTCYVRTQGCSLTEGGGCCCKHHQLAGSNATPLMLTG